VDTTPSIGHFTRSYLAFRLRSIFVSISTEVNMSLNKTEEGLHRL